MFRRKSFGRRLASRGSAGAGFLVRAIVLAAAAAWLFDRERGPERRARVLRWVRSLVGRGREAAAARTSAPGARAGTELPGVPWQSRGEAPREAARGGEDDGG